LPILEDIAPANRFRSKSVFVCLKIENECQLLWQFDKDSCWNTGLTVDNGLPTIIRRHWRRLRQCAATQYRKCQESDMALGEILGGGDFLNRRRLGRKDQSSRLRARTIANKKSAAEDASAQALLVRAASFGLGARPTKASRPPRLFGGASLI
jgi:hypothetical protein